MPSKVKLAHSEQCLDSVLVQHWLHWTRTPREPCTATQSIAVTVSPYVVNMAVSIPMTIPEFDNSKQATFRAAIAAAAGVQNADVTLVKVERISNALRGEEIHAAGRQMLVAGIRIDMSINAARPREQSSL